MTVIANEANLPLLAIVGSAATETTGAHHEPLDESIDIVSLTELFGAETAFEEPKRCIERAASEWLSERL
jgi:hypothetical protein